MKQGQMAIGSVEGTGSAINVEVGFTPSYVRCFNYDDAGGLAPTMEWWQGMTDGHGLKTLKSVDNGTTGNASSAKVTSNGISAYGGATGANGAGFTIGADADLNASGETIFYIAIRKDN